MGYWKELSITPKTSNKQICYDCINEAYLKKYIKENADNNNCSYCCRKTLNTPISIGLGNFIQLIEKGLLTEYEECPFEGEAAIYLDEQTHSLEDLIFFLDISDNPEVRNDIVTGSSIFSFIHMVDWYGGSMPSWQHYCTAVEGIEHITDKFDISGEEASMSSEEMIRVLVQYIHTHNLFKKISRKENIYKVRKNICECTLDTLGAHTKTKESRFSKASYPSFYGSLDAMTAAVEGGVEAAEFTLGVFNLKKKLQLLDFTNLRSKEPSIFDIPNEPIRKIILFIEGFVEAIDKHISEDVEYKPIYYIT